MNSTDWAEITCTVPESLTDDLADFLLEVTGNGVSIENRQVDTFDIATLPDEPLKQVKCYLPDDDRLESAVAGIADHLAGLANSCPGFQLVPPQVATIKEEDWANSWKANFKPSRIGKRLVIKPSWETVDAGPGDILLELDPGMAFGTGTHATTRLCLEALEMLVFEEDAFRANRAVLDVGCGSGVLGIAAALFGAERVVAVDIDPVAVAVTVENALMNNVEGTLAISSTTLESIGGEFAIVLANILAEELVRLAGPLVDRVAGGGYLVLSGILAEREQFVVTGFTREDLSLKAVFRQDEWCCIVFGKHP